MNHKEEMWYSFFLMLPQAMLILDQSGAIKFVNKAWLSLVQTHGLPEAKTDMFIGRSYVNGLGHLRDVVLSDKAYAIHMNALSEIMAGNADTCHDYPCLTKNARAWLSLNLTQLATGQIILTWTDITSHIQGQQTSHLAYVDPLTGLNSHSYFMHYGQDLINLARRQKQKLYLLLLDLDGFKSINEEFGHDVGDQLLSEVAQRLKLQTRDSDMFARLGGDEFVALLAGNGNLESITERYRLILSIPFKLKNQTRKVSISIGTASFPEDAISITELIRIADENMYEDKQAKAIPSYIANKTRVLKALSLEQNVHASGLWEKN